MKHRRVPLAAVVLWSLSISMGLMATRAAGHQSISVNPHLYCGQTVDCHE